MDAKTIWELTFSGITAVATAVTSFSIVLLYRGFKVQLSTYRDEYSWRRQNLGIDVLREWNTHTIEYRDNIVDWSLGKYGEPPPEHYIHPITPQLAQEIYHGREPDERKLRREITSLLNYFEYIGSAYLREAVDRTIIDESLRNAMKKWYRDLSGYMDYVDEHNHNDTWPPFREVVKLWTPLPVMVLPPPPPPSPFGRGDVR